MKKLSTLQEVIRALCRNILAFDAAEQKWITVNGAHIPVGEGGELEGKVGKKIQSGAKYDIKSMRNSSLFTRSAMEKMLSNSGIEFTKENSKSYSDNHGASISAYYKIKHPETGEVIKVRSSDHDFIPGGAKNDVELKNHSNAYEALEKVSQKLGLKQKDIETALSDNDVQSKYDIFEKRYQENQQAIKESKKKDIDSKETALKEKFGKFYNSEEYKNAPSTYKEAKNKNIPYFIDKDDNIYYMGTKYPIPYGGSKKGMTSEGLAAYQQHRKKITSDSSVMTISYVIKRLLNG